MYSEEENTPRIIEVSDSDLDIERCSDCRLELAHKGILSVRTQPWVRSYPTLSWSCHKLHLDVSP